MAIAAAASTSFNSVDGVLIFFSVLLLCFAFAWDGLVRKRVVLPTSPLGGSSAVVSGVWAVLVGMIAALLGLFMLFGVLVFTVDGIVHCQGSLACIGGMVRQANWILWPWLSGILIWIVLIWRGLSNPYKRVLVYGVWYRQDKVARLVQQELADHGLKALPTDRVYVLEIALVQFMHEQHWLVNGKTWLDGGKYTAKDIPTGEMVEIVLNQTVFRQSSKSQRAAIEFLLGYFKTEAGRAQRMSPFYRWLVGTAQIGKRQVYGRHAV